MELFLIGKELTYQMILDTINSQIDNYQESSTYKLELEIEKLKLELQKKDNISEEHIKILCSKMEIFLDFNKKTLVKEIKNMKE